MNINQNVILEEGSGGKRDRACTAPTPPSSKHPPIKRREQRCAFSSPSKDIVSNFPRATANFVGAAAASSDKQGSDPSSSSPEIWSPLIARNPYQEKEMSATTTSMICAPTLNQNETCIPLEGVSPDSPLNENFLCAETSEPAALKQHLFVIDQNLQSLHLPAAKLLIPRQLETNLTTCIPNSDHQEPPPLVTPTNTTQTAPLFSNTHPKDWSNNLLDRFSDLLQPFQLKRIIDRHFEKTINEVTKGRKYVQLKQNQHVYTQSFVTKMKAAFTQQNKLARQVSKKKFSPRTGLERRLYGAAALMSPKLSFEKFELIATCIRTATFEEMSLLEDERFSPNSIITSGITRGCIGDVFLDAAVDSLFLKRQKIIEDDDLAVYTGIDKGPRGDFVKVLANWDEKENRIDMFLLDNEVSGGTNAEAAMAVQHSLKRMELGETFKLHGFTSDAGGGGTREGMKAELEKLNLVIEDSLFGTCALHGLQIILKQACDKCIGIGNMENRNGVQIIHAIYDIQQKIGMKTWRALVKKATAKLGIELKGKVPDSDFVHKLQAPILTRWWTVGEAAKFLAQNCDILQEVCFLTVKMSRPERDKGLSKIASKVCSQFLEDTIVSDVKLIQGFNDFFLAPHFAWMQKGDKRLGDTPGFIGRHMLGRYFLMRSDLLSLQTNWENVKEFKPFLDTLTETSVSSSQEEASSLDQPVGPSPPPQSEPTLTTLEMPRLRDMKRRNLNAESQKKKAKKFFEVALEYLDKHFKQYAERLLFLGVFGDFETGCIVAKKICNPQSMCTTSVTSSYGSYNCPFQKRKIDLDGFASFVDDMTEHSCITGCRQLHKIGDARIRLIATGPSIWDENVEQQYQDVKKFYLRNYAAFMTTTHCVENAVKKSKIADNGHRNETRQTQYVIGTNDVEDINRMTITAMKKSGKHYKKTKGSRKAKESSDYSLGSEEK